MSDMLPNRMFLDLTVRTGGGRWMRVELDPAGFPFEIFDLTHAIDILYVILWLVYGIDTTLLGVSPYSIYSFHPVLVRNVCSESRTRPRLCHKEALI